MLHTAVLLAFTLVVGCGKADSPKPDPAPAAKPDPAPAAKPDPAPAAKPDPVPVAAPDPSPAPIDCEGYADRMVELSRGINLEGLQGKELKAATQAFEAKAKGQHAELIDTCKKIGEKDRAHVACIIKAKTPDDARGCPPPEN